MEAVAAHARYVAAGVVDAFALGQAFHLVYMSPVLMERTLRNARFNGLLFLGSLVIFHYGLMPLVDVVQAQLWDAIGALRPATAPPPAWSLSNTQALTARLLTNVFYGLWVYPCYLVSYLWCQPLCQEIADELARQHEAARPEPAGPAAATPTAAAAAAAAAVPPQAALADSIYRTALTAVFLLLAVAVAYVPVAGPPLSFVLFCWLCALYSFEYHWVHRGWSAERRARFFETHWSYFLGLGLPYTVTSVVFPGMVSNGIFALVYPVYIVMASQARPQPLKRETPVAWARVPVFHAAAMLTTALVQHVAPGPS